MEEFKEIVMTKDQAINTEIGLKKMVKKKLTAQKQINQTNKTELIEKENRTNQLYQQIQFMESSKFLENKNILFKIKVCYI